MQIWTVDFKLYLNLRNTVMGTKTPQAENEWEMKTFYGSITPGQTLKIAEGRKKAKRKD